MKALNEPNPAGLSQVFVRPASGPGIRSVAKRSVFAGLAACAGMALTGCTTIRSVNKTVRAPNVLDATLEQLNGQIAARYEAIQTINAAVDIKASTGGEHQGEVTEYPAFAGYILLRKPSDMRVFMLVPVVRSLALDMVSDGKDFKLLIPPKNKAIVGLDKEVTTPSKNGLENLRPYIIRDALLIPPVLSDELVGKTEGARILPAAKGKKETTEEPDYDLTVTRVKSGRELQTIRVIHISRVTLKPYEQDIYDATGRKVTIVTYDKYQKFGDIEFPMSILITRPLDEYSLNIVVTKLTLNQKLDDESFALKIPEGISVQTMDSATPDEKPAGPGKNRR